MWLFALPAVLINAVIILIPALLTFAAAFAVWDGVGLPAWAGLANFERMFDDPVFWSSLGNNLVWAEQYQAGIEVLNQVIRKAPGTAEAYVRLAEAYRSAAVQSQSRGCQFGPAG